MLAVAEIRLVRDIGDATVVVAGLLARASRETVSSDVGVLCDAPELLEICEEANDGRRPADCERDIEFDAVGGELCTSKESPVGTERRGSGGTVIGGGLRP